MKRRLVALCLLVLAPLALTIPADRAADPVPLYKAGIAAKKAGDLAGAEQRFRDCLAADPKYGRCHFSLGVLLKKKELLDDAERHFRKALEAHPKWGQAQFSLGMTLLKKAQPDLAKQAFEAAIADPDLDADDRAESWNAIGVMHRQAARYKEAVVAYDQAIAAKPAASFHHNKGVALAHLGDLKGAEAAAMKATELAPDDATFWAFLAKMRAEDKRVVESLPAWRRVTELAPRGPEGWYGLGEAAEAAGDKPLARKAFETYLEVAGPDAERASIEARIEKNR